MAYLELTMNVFVVLYNSKFHLDEYDDMLLRHHVCCCAVKLSHTDAKCCWPLKQSHTC